MIVNHPPRALIYIKQSRQPMQGELDRVGTFSLVQLKLGFYFNYSQHEIVVKLGGSSSAPGKRKQLFYTKTERRLRAQLPDKKYSLRYYETKIKIYVNVSAYR